MKGDDEDSEMDEFYAAPENWERPRYKSGVMDRSAWLEQACRESVIMVPSLASLSATTPPQTE